MSAPQKTKAATRPKRQASKTGPSALTGSTEAKRVAAVLLEVLSGLVGPQDGAHTLGISLSRYYVLETRALQGFLAALEPRPKGRTVRPEQRLEAAERDKRRLERELARHQVLLRAAHRSLGLPSGPRAGASSTAKDKPAAREGKPRRRRRRIGRAAGAITALREASPTQETTGPPPASPTAAAGD